MSDPSVSSFLINLLCNHEGRLRRSQLGDLLQLPPEQIDQILQEEPLRFSVSDDLVLARTSLRICPRYLKDEEEEEPCDKLHLCRHYLLGKCWTRGRRAPCRFSHDTDSEHNKAVLKAHENYGFNDDGLKVLLLQNDHSLLPEVCLKYLHASCDRENGCARLHVCGYFTRGECSRQNCRHSHCLLESSIDYIKKQSCRSLVSIENFQMLCVIKCNEAVNMRKAQAKDGEQCGPSGAGRGRGRGRGKTQKRRGRPGHRPGRGSRSHSTPGRGDSRCSTPDELDGDDDDGVFDPHSGDKQDEFAPMASAVSMTFFSTRQPTPYPLLEIPPRTRSLNINDLPIYSGQKVNSQENYVPAASVLKTQKTKSAVISPNNHRLTNTGTVQQKPNSNIISPNSHVAPFPTSTTERKYNSTTSILGMYTAPTTTSVEKINYTTTNPGMSATIGSISVKQKVNSTTSGMSATSSSTSGVNSTTTNPSMSATNGSTSVAQKINSTTTGMSATNGSTSVAQKINSTTTGMSATNGSTSVAQKVNSTTTGMSATSSSTSVAQKINSTTTGMSATTGSTSVAQKVNSTATGMSATSSSTSGVNTTTTSPSISATTGSTSVAQKVNSTTTGMSATTSYTYGVSSTTSSPVNLPVYITKKEPDRPVEYSEICLHHIWKYCRLGNKCSEMHYHLPYRWQEKLDNKWQDATSMDAMERAFCQPKNDSYFGISFATMTYGPIQIRRLSTPSSATRSPEFVLTTEWIWYWQDELGTWIEYGKSNTKQVSASITSLDLESIYLADPKSVVPFQAGGQSYEISFNDMIQKNIAYKTQKRIRRRPKYQSCEDVQKLRGTIKEIPSSSPLRNGNYPSDWDTSALPEIGYKLVPVPESSPEYTRVLGLFNKTMSGQTVKIQRIQNKSLWEVYQWQKVQMQKVNPGKGVNEKQLFHGTHPSHRIAICHHNFDWRVCGTNGTVYGQGSYFARDASYSHNYSVTSTGKNMMFVARVLVGDYVTGNSTLKRPPMKPGSSTQCYDSCVDTLFNPSIFVVFEKHQIYPEYLLEYEPKKEEKSCCIS